MNQKGYLALVSILVVLSVALVLGLSISFGVSNEMQMNLQFKKSKEAFYLAESCANRALLELSRNPSYTGEELTFPAGRCTMNITSQTIETVGIIDESIYRKINIQYQSPPLTVLNWQEQ